MNRLQELLESCGPEDAVTPEARALLADPGILATCDAWEADPETGPRVVAIGGGTGLSTLLRGVKRYTRDLTAVVTVSDDGGGSGMLREDLGMIPPGDIRNCILALADVEPLMHDLLRYRFPSGRLAGQSFGNLMLAAMNGISSNFAEAVANVSRVLAVQGRVLPVSLCDVALVAEMSDGSTVRGESAIGGRTAPVGRRILRVRMEPADAPPWPEALAAIRSADLLVLGPGSLYTSVVPNLLHPGVVEAIRSSLARRIYVVNIMTQRGESEGYTSADHLATVLRHAGQATCEGLADACVVHTGTFDDATLQDYAREDAAPVAPLPEALREMGLEVFGLPLATPRRGASVRHDAERLAAVLMAFAAGRERIFTP